MSSASRPLFRRNGDRFLAASLATLLLLVGCSGTKIPSSSDATSDGGPGGGAGNGNGGGGNGAGNGGGVDAGSTMGGACPCALESYCDLTTNTCKSGCTEDTQCNPGRSCDIANRVCQDKCSGAACGALSCPAPAPKGTQACNGIAVDGAKVNVACKTGAVPTPKGGVIKEGAYALTAVEVYQSGCTPSTARGQVYVCGSTWSFAFDQATGTINDSTTTASAASTTTYSLSRTCPAGSPLGGDAPQVVGYDATATTLVLYVGGPDNPEVDHYALR